MPRVYKDLGTEDSPEYLTLISLLTLGSTGQSFSQSQVVSSLSDLDLTEGLLTSPPSGVVSTGLRRLLEKGLVGKIDTRPSTYYITNRGWDLLEETGILYTYG